MNDKSKAGLRVLCSAVLSLCLPAVCRAACQSFNGEPERRVIVILDKSGSMDEREESSEITGGPRPHPMAEGKDGNTRMDFAQWDIALQTAEEIKRGTERLKIYLIPFDDSKIEHSLIEGNGAAIMRNLAGFLRKNPPRGGTNIGAAFDYARELMAKPEFGLTDNMEIKILYYSDGEQEWPYDPHLNREQNDAKYRDVRNKLVRDALKNFSAAVFDYRKRMPNLYLKTFVRHWGVDPLKRLNVPKDAQIELAIEDSRMDDNRLRARVTLTGIDITQQGRAGNGSFFIDGVVKGSGNNIGSADLEISLEAGGPQLVKPFHVLAGNDLQFKFHIPIDADKLPAEPIEVKVMACLVSVVPDVQGRPIDRTNIFVASSPIRIDNAPQLRCETPPSGHFQAGFRSMGVKIPELATMRFRWNAAGATVPLDYKANFPRFEIKAFMRGASGEFNVELPHPFTLGMLNSVDQTGELQLSVTALEATKQDALPIMQIFEKDNANGFKLDVKADINVSSPVLRVDPVNQDKFLYDRDKIGSLDIVVAHLLPAFGAAGRQVGLEVLAVPGVKASIRGEGISNGVLTLPDRSIELVLHLELKDEDTLKSLKPGDIKLFVRDNSNQLKIKDETTPLNLTFEPKLVLDISGKDSSGKPFDDLKDLSKKRGTTLRFELLFTWNDAAIGKKVVHSFQNGPVILDDNAVELTLEPGNIELGKDLKQLHSLKVKLLGTGKFKPKLEFYIEDKRRILQLPEIEVTSANLTADFKPSQGAATMDLGKPAKMGTLLLGGDKDAAGEGYKISLTAPVGMRVWLERADNGAKFLEGDGKSIDKELLFDSPNAKQEFTLMGVLSQKYLNQYQSQSGGKGWELPELKVVRFEEGRPTKVYDLAPVPDLSVQIPAFGLAWAGTGSSHEKVRTRKAIAGNSWSAQMDFSDITQPEKLQESFWKQGGGSEGVEVELKANDTENFSVLFGNGTAKMPLRELYEAKSVPVLIKYIGPTSSTGELKRILVISASLKSADGVAPAMTMSMKEEFDFLIQPSIPAVLIGIGVLFVLMVIGGIIFAKLNRSSTPEEAPAPPLPPPPPPENLTGGSEGYPPAPEQPRYEAPPEAPPSGDYSAGASPSEPSPDSAATGDGQY